MGARQPRQQPYVGHLRLEVSIHGIRRGPKVDVALFKDFGLAKAAMSGTQTIGDFGGQAELEPSFSGGKIALVLGAEGKGLRQRTREIVTTLALLDMPGAIRSLNVSNAGAVSLYAARRWLKTAR